MAFNDSLVLEISQMSIQNDLWQDSFKTLSKPCSPYAFWLILSSFVARIIIYITGLKIGRYLASMHKQASTCVFEVLSAPNQVREFPG